MAFPTGWGRKCALTIADAMSAGALSDFPLLLTHASGVLPSEMFDADGSNPALNGGGDIRFSSDSAGATQLACEIVSFVTDNDPANGTAEIWVKVPSVAAAAATTIYVWYNKTGETQPAVTDTYGRNAVWSAWEMVHHGGSVVDSTGNYSDITGTALGAASGPFGDAYDYNATTSEANTGLTTHANPRSYVVWYRRDGGGEGGFGRVYDKRDAGIQVEAFYQSTSGGTMEWQRDYAGTSNNRWKFGAGNATATWYMAALVVDTTDPTDALTPYINGALDTVGFYAATGTGSARTNSDQYVIGNRGAADRTWNGQIAGFWVIDSALSSDQAGALYNNQSAPATYITAGTPESAGSTLSTLTFDADGTIGVNTRHDAGTGSPFYTHCNESPTGSPTSTTYVENDTSETSTTANFSLTDVDSDFSDMLTLSITVDVLAQGFGDDTCALTVQIFDADSGGNALTGSVQIATQADTTRTVRTVAFTGIPGSPAATKAQWNSAYARFTWTYVKNTGPDNATVRLYACEINGTYTAGSNTYEDTLSFGSSMATTPTNIATLLDSISLPASLSVSPAGIITIDQSASLNAQAALTAAGGLLIEESITLALQSFLTSSATHTVEETISLAAQLATTLAEILTVEESISLAAQAALTALGNLTIEEAISLASQVDLSAVGGSEINDSVALAINAAIGLVDTLSFEEAITLASSAALTSSNIAVVEASATLASSMALATSFIHTIEETANFAVSVANTHTADGTFNLGIILGASADIQFVGGTDLFESITLATSADIALLAGTEFAETLTLAAQAGLTGAAVVTINGLVSLGATAGFAAAAQQIFDDGVILAAQCDITTTVTGTFEVNLSLDIAADESVSAAGSTYNVDLTIISSAGISASGALEMSASATLGVAAALAAADAIAQTAGRPIASFTVPVKSRTVAPAEGSQARTFVVSAREGRFIVIRRDRS